MQYSSRIRRALAGAWLLSLFLCLPAQAAEVAGVKLDDTARVANQDLKLNGAGVRYKAVFKVYVAGLYLDGRKTSVADVLASNAAKRVTIVMLRDVSNEEFGNSFMIGIQKNSERAEKTRVASQLLKFGELFASIPELKKGDLLTIDWHPGSGTVLQLNGKRIADVIPDTVFYQIILKIWLGEKPADAQLKKHLLGEAEEPARAMF